MTARPATARTVKDWLTDGQYAVFNQYSTPDWTYKPSEFLEWCGLRLLCLIYGHEPYRDTCNRPEHDRCLHCRKHMPGTAPAHTGEEAR